MGVKVEERDEQRAQAGLGRRGGRVPGVVALGLQEAGDLGAKEIASRHLRGAAWGELPTARRASMLLRRRSEAFSTSSRDEEEEAVGGEPA